MRARNFGQDGMWNVSVAVVRQETGFLDDTLTAGRSDSREPSHKQTVFQHLVLHRMIVN
jgi:hypothetical protein